MNAAVLSLLEEAFDRCAGASESQRDAIIAELAKSSPDAAAQLRRMLDIPPVSPSAIAELIGEVAVDASMVEPRRVIGKYTLLSVLGEGGCGIVYLAEQPAPVHRLVALKIIKPGMDTRQVLARFNDERQALALMDHPSVVTSIDAGSTDDGHPYVVMPLIPGLSVTEFCDQERCTIEDRVRIMVKVCRGIEHAHAKGVIHRDIKPGNILVVRHEGEVLPRVIDFGLAKALTDPLTPHATVTLAGQIIGTPEYMSPEQAEGAGADVRTDIYSLGAVLYELLAGLPPIDVQAIRSQGRLQALKATDIVAPSRPATQAFRRELDWIVLKCLEREPHRRYATVSALADDLERYLAGDRVQAGPPAKLYRAARWCVKHRVVLLAIVAVTLSVAVGLVYAEQARRRAEQVAQVTRSILTGVDPAVAQGRDTELLLLMLDRSRGVLEDPTLDPWVDMELRETFAEAYHAAGRLADAGRDAKRADVLIRRFEGEHSPRRLPMLWLQSASLNAGVPPDGVSQHDKPEIHSMMREIAARNAVDDPTLPLKTEVDILRHASQDSELMRPTLAAAEAALGRDHPSTIMMLRTLGGQLMNEGSDEGSRLLEEARRRGLEAFGPDHPLVHLGLTREQFGAQWVAKSDELLVNITRERLADAERVLGRRHPVVAAAYSNRGSAEQQLGRHEDAIVTLEHALLLESEARTEASSIARWTRAHLLESAAAIGRWDVFDRCEATMVRLDPEGPRLARARFDKVIDALRTRGDQARVERWIKARNHAFPDAADTAGPGGG